ncbi:MAG: recombinase family protein [Oscillospiraceae bacterium]|nr:recombinase family protein [Oscillospiraceae bacterium]
MGYNLLNNVNYKVGIYIRLSREDDEKEENEESVSIQNQRTILMQYVKDEELTFVKEYVDEGISGTTFDRPGFNQLLEDIENGIINMVVTKDLSRLGRDYILSGHYVEKYFPEHNVRYIAILDGIDTALDSSSNDIAPFKSVLNDMYAKDISKKINSVLKSKRKEGLYLGNTAPYGYLKDPENKYQLIVDPVAGEVVRTIFKEFLKGKGTMQIADSLSKQNVPIPSVYTNKKTSVKSLNYGLWATSTIRFILSNEVYTGTIVQGKRKKLSHKSKKFINLPEDKWEKVYDMHEPLVSREDFERVRKIIDVTKGSRVILQDYLFKGLLKCHECGGYIGIRSRDKNGNIYGRCQRYGRYGKFDICSPHNFNYEVLEEQLLKVLKDICNKYTDKKKLEEIARQNKSLEEKQEEYIKQINYYSSIIEKEKKKLEIVYEDRLNDVISLEEYTKMSEKIRREIKEHTNEKTKLEEKCKGGACSTQEEETVKLNKLIGEFTTMKNPTKEIIREFIYKIEVYEDKQIDIHFNFKPLEDIQKELENEIFCARKPYKKKIA